MQKQLDVIMECLIVGYFFFFQKKDLSYGHLHSGKNF